MEVDIEVDQSEVDRARFQAARTAAETAHSVASYFKEVTSSSIVAVPSNKKICEYSLLSCTKVPERVMYFDEQSLQCTKPTEMLQSSMVDYMFRYELN